MTRKKSFRFFSSNTLLKMLAELLDVADTNATIGWRSESRFDYPVMQMRSKTATVCRAVRRVFDLVRRREEDARQDTDDGVPAHRWISLASLRSSPWHRAGFLRALRYAFATACMRAVRACALSATAETGWLSDGVLHRREKSCSIRRFSARTDELCKSRETGTLPPPLPSR